MTELARAEVVIGGDNSPLMRALSGSEQAMRNSGRRLRSIGRTLSASVTLPLAAIGAASTKAFASFDSAMTQSLAIMGDVSTTMRNQMVEAARAVGRSTTTGATEAAEAYFFLASAGLDAEQSVAALPAVARFAQAGMFDMARATDLATDAQSALGLASDDAAQNLENLTGITDVLVKANTLANASVSQFATALTSEAGAAMKSFEIDIEEGVAVLAAFADQGIKGERAGMGFSRVLRLMSQAANNSQTELAELGIEFFDQQGNLRNLADIVENMEVAFQGMSDEERTAALEAAGFTARVQGMLLPLLGTSGAIREYEAGLREAAGTTQEVSDKQLQSFSAQMELAKNNVVIAAQALGEVLAPRVLFVSRLVSRLAQRIAALDPRVLAGAAAFGVLAAAIGPSVTVLGLFLSAAGTLIGTITSMVGAVTSLGGAVAGVVLAMNPWVAAIGVVVAALATLGGGFSGLVDTVKGAINIVVGMFNFLGRVAVIVWQDAIRAPFIAAFEVIRSTGQRVLGAVASALEKVGRLGEGAAEKIRSFFRDAAEGAEEEGADFGTKLANAAVEAFGQDYAGAFQGVVSEALQKANARVQSLLARLRALGAAEEEEDGAAAGERRPDRRLAGTMLQALGRVEDVDLSAAFDAATRSAIGFGVTAEGVADSFVDSFSSAFTSLVTGARNFASAFTDMAKSILADIARMIGRALALRAVLSFVPGGAALLGAGGLGGIPGRQFGGSVRANRPVVVGERRAEVFVPSTSGRIMPDAGGMGGASNVAAAILQQVGPPPSSAPPSTIATDRWWREVHRLLAKQNRERTGEG